METSEMIVRKAREAVIRQSAFFTALLLRQEVVAVEWVDAMATDGKCLYYNPTWVQTQPDPELQFVVAHEACHPALLHHTRMGGKDPELWNMATDYQINPIILEAGIGRAPAGILLRDDLAHIGAEKAYRILWDELQQQQADEQPQQGDSNNGDDSESDASSDPGQDATGSDDEEKTDADGEGEESPEHDGSTDDGGNGQSTGDHEDVTTPEESDGQGGDGNAESDQQQAGETKDDDPSKGANGNTSDGRENKRNTGESGDGDSKPDGSERAGSARPGVLADGPSDTNKPQHVSSYGGCGAVLPAPVESEGDRASEESEWRTATVQAANFERAKRGAGTIGDNLAHAIESVCTPVANWRELLSRWMDQHATTDDDWSHPDRRLIGDGIYCPDQRAVEMGPLAFVVDASYSMPRSALEEAQAEIQSACEMLQPAWVDVIVHTEEIKNVERFERGEEIKVNVPGRGGTLFAPVCQHINEADDPYAVAVWFTDMDAFDWDLCEEPVCDVLFLDHDNNRLGAADDATFGEVIGMEDV